MLVEISGDDHRRFFGERQQKTKTPLFITVIVAFVVTAASASAFWLSQWLGGVLILAISIILFLLNLNASRAKANSAIRRKMFLGEMDFDISPYHIEIKKGDSCYSLNFIDMLKIEEGKDFFYMEHSIGLAFFLPKYKLCDGDIAIIKAIMMKRNTP